MGEGAEIAAIDERSCPKSWQSEALTASKASVVGKVRPAEDFGAAGFRSKV